MSSKPPPLVRANRRTYTGYSVTAPCPERSALICRMVCQRYGSRGEHT